MAVVHSGAWFCTWMVSVRGDHKTHQPPSLPGFTIIIEPFDDRTPTIANPILHFR